MSDAVPSEAGQGADAAMGKLSEGCIERTRVNVAHNPDGQAVVCLVPTA